MPCSTRIDDRTPLNSGDARKAANHHNMNALLAFDTATEQMSIAVAVAGRVWTHEAVGGAQASATLIPAILALLAQAGVVLRDVDALAFGRGPGAFTGLRTACSVAQGLAFGAAKPVLPIDTLLTIAEVARAGAPAWQGWVTMDARMDEIYAGHYRFASGRWQVLGAPRLTTSQALNEFWLVAPPEAVAGNALAVFGDRLATGFALRIPGAMPRASAMLPLARQLWLDGGAVDAALALPTYLRDKVAQTTAEREAVRSAQAAGVST
jgi:tRNA threonylcarbamoyladenosine biosynthesis protein TsaB